MIYEVLIVPAAKLRIRQQVEYIATEEQAPEAAARWLARLAIVDETQTVWVIHAKHDKQLTRPDGFPADLMSLEDDDEDE